MKKLEKKLKQLVLNGLFYRTTSEGTDISIAINSHIDSLNKSIPKPSTHKKKKHIIPPEIIGGHCDIGGQGPGFIPTYQLHHENFKEFVKALNRINTRYSEYSWLDNSAARLRPCYSSTTTKGEFFEDWLPGQRTISTPSANKQQGERAKFRAKYKDAIEALSCEQFLSKTLSDAGWMLRPKGLINMELYPRNSKEQKLFLSCIIPLLTFLDANHRLNLQGPNGGQHSLTAEDKATIDKLHRRKGTEKGSIRFIGEELRIKAGLVTTKKEPKYQQRVKRYLRRKK